MSLTVALEDLKYELANGVAVEKAVARIAEEHGLREIFLQNRAAAVLGDLGTFAERHALAVAAERANLEGAKKKMALAKLREQIDNHNNGTKRVDTETLEVFCAAANALGGDYTLVRRGQRRPPSFDSLMKKLIKELLENYPMR